MIWTAPSLRDQTTARAYFLSETGRPILPATSFLDQMLARFSMRSWAVMPRDGAIVFSDLIGKLDMLRVACEKCGRWLLRAASSY